MPVSLAPPIPPPQGGDRPALHDLRVALVYPPYGPVRNEPGIKVVKENYGIFPSLSLLYVAGVLEAAGCKVLFIDAHAEGLDLDETVRRLKAFNPAFIGYTITTYLFFQTLSWIDAIRAQVPVPTLVGGAHLSMYPRETLHWPSIDYAVTGEAEVSLPALLEALVLGRPLEEVRGIAFRGAEGDSRVVVTPPEAPIDVNLAPLPARGLIDNSIYYSFISRYKNFTPIITSRGCPFRCIFCEQGSKPWRARTPENVVDELELVQRDYGVREIDVFDSSFTIRKDRVLAICDLMVRRGIRLVWAARTRVDRVDREVLAAMRKAGCERIYYGIESGNREILKVLRKATSLDQIRDVIRQTREQGIDAFGYFMIGNPYEDAATIRQTIRFSLDLDLDYAQFSKVTPMPGTELYEMLLAQTGRDWWREYILEGGREPQIPRPHCDMSEDEVQAWTRLAYLRFYYRPRYIARALRRVKSWPELQRSISTALEMIRPPTVSRSPDGTEVLA